MNPAKTLVQARLMITFSRIVEAGGVSAAATRLGVDKGSISRQLCELEEMLGVRLLNRSSRKFSVTDIGQIVLDRAARVLAEVESAQVEAETFRSSLSGTLSVSTSVAFGRTQVVPHLPRFLRENPQLEVNLCLLDRHVDMIEEGFDVLIRLCDQPPEHLVAHRLSSIGYSVVAAPSLTSSLSPVREPSDLPSLPCLFYGYRKRKAIWKFQRGTSFLSAEVSSRVSVNSSDAVLSMTLDGMGVALLPTFLIAGALQEGLVVELLPEFTALGNLGSALFALHLPGRFMPPKVNSFVKYLKAEWVQSATWAA